MQRVTPSAQVGLWAIGLAALGLVGARSSRAAAGVVPLPRGEVIERVACTRDATQTYAIYLPSAYTPDRSWPIVYAFDPAARGAVPVRLFSKPAERLGYVVVASNNSRNGPFAPVLAAMNAVWGDTHERLALDPERIYATGMSGGTMPAMLLATSQGAGLIACAGAINDADLPKSPLKLCWLGIAGDADFNLDLTKELVQGLVKRRLVARFATFEGGHGWPPAELVERAMDWLELSAMRTGKRAADPAFVDAQYEQGLARARALAAGGLLAAAAEENAALAREFSGLKPSQTLQALDAESRRLRETPEAKRERKRDQTRSEREHRLLVQLLSLRRTLEQAGRPTFLSSDQKEYEQPMDSAYAGQDLDSHLARLTREIASADPEVRLVAKRVTDGFYIETFYHGGELRGQRQFDAAQADYEICAKMRPGVAAPVYEMARTHAARGDRKKALAELRKAIGLGFTDVARLSADSEWEALRGQPEFQAILEQLRTSR